MTQDVGHKPGGGSRRWQFLFQNRFAVLLCAMVIQLISAPIVSVFEPGVRTKLANVVIPVFFVAVLLSTVFAVSRTRRTEVAAILLAIPAIILQALQAWFDSENITIASHLLGIAFIAFAVTLVLKFLFTSRTITTDMICASLCVYLMVGIMCAVAYSLFYILDPNSFVFSFAEERAPDAMRFGGERTFVAIYYSFVTMSTLGYGDIVPISSPARICAAMQAVVGQLYLAVLVARLVGLHISQASETSSTGQN